MRRHIDNYIIYRRRKNGAYEPISNPIRGKFVAKKTLKTYRQSYPTWKLHLFQEVVVDDE